MESRYGVPAAVVVSRSPKRALPRVHHPFGTAGFSSWAVGALTVESRGFRVASWRAAAFLAALCVFGPFNGYAFNHNDREVA